MTSTELKSIREKLNLSKTDLAKAIGIAPTMEGKYEKGSLVIPETVEQAVYELMNKMEKETASVSADDEVVVEKIPASEVEVITTPVADEVSAEEDKPAADASSVESVVDFVSYGPAAIPFFLPPLLMTKFLLDFGAALRGRRKKGIFGPWW